MVFYANAPVPKRFTTSTAVDHLKAQWHNPENKHALLQLVLDNPLLALDHDSFDTFS
jgi:hypothetical protein